MNLKNLSKIKNKLKLFIKDSEIIDIIIFGSSAKGKSSPKDIDIALITDKKITKQLEGLHISIIRPKEFFQNPPSIATTILREGFSIRNNKPYAEAIRFNSKTLFIYILKNLNASNKVRISRILHGNKKDKGMVEKEDGKWLSNQVFTTPIEKDYLFEQFFIQNRINFNKYNLLIH